MHITIKFEVEKSHIVWAAYMLLGQGKRISKTAVVNYLRDQYELYGIDNTSLMGENYIFGVDGNMSESPEGCDDLDGDENYNRACRWAEENAHKFFGKDR